MILSCGCNSRDLSHKNTIFSQSELSPHCPHPLFIHSGLFHAPSINACNNNEAQESSPPEPPKIPVKSPKSRSFRGFKLNSYSKSAAPHQKLPTCGKRKQFGGSLPLVFRALETSDDDVDKTLHLWVGKLSSKELTVVLKEQRDWRCMLRVFQLIKSQEDYVPNVIHYNVVLRMLGRARQWDELHLCWLKMAKDGVFPTNNTYGMLIDVYAKAGLVKEALLWLKHMKARGVFPDEVTVNTAVRVLKDAGEYDQADQLFKSWCSGRLESGDLDFGTVGSDLDSSPVGPKQFLLTELFKAGGGIPPAKALEAEEEWWVRKPRLAATYNTLIDLYGKAGRLTDASNAFAEMLKSGVAPDIFTFNTMINVCGTRGHLSEAESLLSKLEERGLSPDVKTFNIFLSLYGNVGNINAVFSMYRKINEVGLCPDVVTYRTILQILCARKMVEEVEAVLNDMETSSTCVDERSLPVVMKMYVEEGLLEKAKIFLETHCVNSEISSKTYAAIIDAYAEKGHWAEAEFVFENRGSGRKDTVEYNVMIKAYGRARLFKKALSLFRGMRMKGHWPDECTYNSLIQMLSGGNWLESVRDLMIKMREVGLKPRCETYSAIISSYIRTGRISDAVDLFQEMVRDGVEPNEVVYGSLIHAFAEEGKVEEALNYFHMMEESGLMANQIIYTSLLRAYGKMGCWREAQELYEKVQGLEGGPDVIASNCMLDLYSDLDMLHEAELIFGQLKETGCADVVSFTTMMFFYRRVGRLDKAIDVAQEMQQSGFLDSSASYCNAMKSYSANGQLRECGELLHQMLKKKIPPNASIFRVMFAVLDKGGMPMEALAQLKTLYKDMKPYAKQAIVTSVFSLVGLHDIALKCCETFMKSGIELDSSAYNVAIYAYGASGKVDDALNIFMRMQDMGLTPDVATYIYLVVCYGKAGLVEGIKRIYNLMKFGEIEPNESLFRAVISAYKDVGRQSLAEMVYQEMKFTFQSQEEQDSDVEFDLDPPTTDEYVEPSDDED